MLFEDMGPFDFINAQSDKLLGVCDRLNEYSDFLESEGFTAFPNEIRSYADEISEKATEIRHYGDWIENTVHQDGREIVKCHK